MYCDIVSFKTGILFLTALFAFAALPATEVSAQQEERARSRYGDAFPEQAAAQPGNVLPHLNMIDQRNIGIDLFISGMVIQTLSVAALFAPVVLVFSGFSSSGTIDGFSLAVGIGLAAVITHPGFGIFGIVTGSIIWITGAILWGAGNAGLRQPAEIGVGNATTRIANGRAQATFGLLGDTIGAVIRY